MKRFVVSTLRFCKKRYSNVVVAASIILSFVSIILMLEISFNGFRQDWQPGAKNPEDNIKIIGKVEDVSLMLKTYNGIQSFNSWLIFIRLLFDFGFSRELSLVIDLIYSAAFDIIFFCLTFILVEF